MGKSSGSDRKGRPASSKETKQPEWSSYMAETIANTIDAYKKMSREEKAKARKNLIEQYASRVNSVYRFGENPQDSEHVRAAEYAAKQLGFKLPKIKDTESPEARYKAYKQAQLKKLGSKLPKISGKKKSKF